MEDVDIKVKAFKRNFGFTLIELLVTIAILSILATVAMVQYSGVTRTTRDSKRVQDLKGVQKALEQYFVANRSYPKFTIAAGVDLDTITTNNFGSFFESGTPPKDSSGVPYRYHSDNQSAGCLRYMVCTTLESCSGGSCNRDVDPNLDALGSKDGCAAVVSNPPTSGEGRFCVGALSQ